jgi:hypothetical protein
MKCFYVQRYTHEEVIQTSRGRKIDRGFLELNQQTDKEEVKMINFQSFVLNQKKKFWIFL